MNATKKMDRLGLKALLPLVQAIRPGTALETLYRWRTALNSGIGIRDANKGVLVEATKGTEDPIGWSDFHPVEPAEVVDFAEAP